MIFISILSNLFFFFNLEYKRWSKNISTDILILETQKIALLSFVILKWKSPCTKTFFDESIRAIQKQEYLF